MRTITLLNNADASTTQIGSYEIDCGQDMRWLLKVKGTGLDGTPKVYVEDTTDNVEWLPLENSKDCTDFFLLDSEFIHIRDSYFMGKSIRVRVEPEDNTTGTLDAEIVVKTKSN